MQLSNGAVVRPPSRNQKGLTVYLYVHRYPYFKTAPAGWKVCASNQALLADALTPTANRTLFATTFLSTRAFVRYLDH